MRNVKSDAGGPENQGINFCWPKQLYKVFKNKEILMQYLRVLKLKCMHHKNFY